MFRAAWLMLCAPLLASITPGTALAQAPAPVAATPANHPQLVKLFEDWRAFIQPSIQSEVPDYSAAAMQRKARELPLYRSRLSAIDRSGWSEAALNDYRLVEAEMNGFDFYLRLLQPWARDPGFYRTIFEEESDVPAHEGSSAYPNIDLFAFKWPLSRADDQRLTSLIGAVPAMLAAARTNLSGSNARDLWLYGDRTFKEQSATLAALDQGTLVMRTLEGHKSAVMTGASPALRRAIRNAKAATDDFASWVAAEAKGKNGPSGIGKANYNWYVANVDLSPYNWDQQVVILRRELERSLASLRLEELRNRNLPPIAPIDDPAAYRKMAEAKTERFNNFLVETGFVPDRPYFREALRAQTSSYVPLNERNFFSHGTALDPLPLLSHATHWIELARLKHEPHASPIRRVAPLFNIFSDRSEGFATAMEEAVMHAGLYDDIPHGRELVWIMLANRAARGLASLYVQANEMDLAQAGKFHAEWTPRHWSDPASPLVGFEQLLYLRQPGYGPSYVLGKMQLDRLIALASHEAEQSGRPLVMREVMARVIAPGILPPALIEREMFGQQTLGIFAPEAQP